MSSQSSFWPGVVLALLTGTITVLPQFLIPWQMGESFAGILPLLNPDVPYYLSRIKEVLDGYPTLNHVYLWEFKQSPDWHQVFLAEVLLAQPLKLFAWDIISAHKIYCFVLPALATFFCYRFFQALSLSVAASSFFTIWLFQGMWWREWMRPVSPQFNFLFFLSFIFLLRAFLNKPYKKSLLFLLCLNLGFLFYIYVYYWTQILVLLGLLFLAYWRSDRQRSLGMLKITCGALMVALPFIYYTLKESQLPEYGETLARLGMISSHLPSALQVSLWCFGVLLIYYWVKKKFQMEFNHDHRLLIASLISTIIAANHNLITGQNLLFSFHYNMAGSYLCVFALAALWPFVRSAFPQTWLKTAVASLVILFSLAYYAPVWKTLFSVTGSTRERQAYRPVLDWLNQHLSKDSVVFSDDDFCKYVPLYTDHNIYYSRHTNLYTMSDDEVERRAIINHWWEQWDAQFIRWKTRFFHGSRYVEQNSNNFRKNVIRRPLGLDLLSQNAPPDQEIKRLLDKVADFKKIGWHTLTANDRLDAIVWNRKRFPYWEIAELDGFKEFYRDKVFSVYRKTESGDQKSDR